MAVTIDAPPDQVWPWLVQLGGDRGGWYSWDRLDNGGRPSAHEVHPEWQDLALGDYVKYWSAPRPRGRLAGRRARTESVPGTARVERSAGPHSRSEAATAIGLHGRAVGLPAERAARRPHTSGHRRLSGLPPSMARALLSTTGSTPGRLDHAGADVVRPQAERRTSGRRGTNRCRQVRLRSPSGCATAAAIRRRIDRSVLGSVARTPTHAGLVVPFRARNSSSPGGFGTGRRCHASRDADARRWP